VSYRRPARLRRARRAIASVPEARAGYYWLAGLSVRLGTADLCVIEGNDHASFDLRIASAAAHPTVLGESGCTQFRMRKAADSNPSVIATTAAVRAGWTGSTCICGWFRLPDAAGAITGNGNVFQHGIATGSQLRINHTLTVASGMTLIISSDGSATANNTYTNPLLGGDWVFMAMSSPDAAGVDNATRLTLSANLSAKTKTGGSSAGAVPTSIADSSAKISVACRGNTGLANVDTTDWASLYYLPGLPSTADLAILANAYNPKGVSL